MAKDKKSFIAYADWQETFNALPNDKAGQLIKHLLAYVNDEEPETDDVLINAVFANIKQTLKRDLKKYESIREKRSEAGKASAEKRKQNQQVLTSVKQTSTNPTVSDNVSVNVSDSDIKRKEKIIEGDFNIFWELYHETTGLLKTDREPALKHYKKLSKFDRNKATDGILEYFNSLSDKKYCKKARTYLSDKSFNDEYHSLGTDKELPSHLQNMVF